MERLRGPDILRTYADALEDKRHLENVERCKRCPELDQHMLLALNRTEDERLRLPNAGIAISWLKERLIEVSTSDKQTAILGLFYTTIDPLKTQPFDSIKRKPEVTIGIFPLYDNSVKYTIRPLSIDLRQWNTCGEIILKQESIVKKDPFVVVNPKGPNFLFFKKSPFQQDHPYKIDWSKKSYDEIIYPKFLGLSLEENLVDHTLWCLNHHHARPELFKKTGFTKFINSHCSDPKYAKLHAAFIQSKCPKKH